MSRNFEVLQRLERERAKAPFTISGVANSTAPVTVAPPFDQQRPGLRTRPGIPTSEVEKLVQRLFLTNDGTAEKPLVVAFASIDSGDGTTSICSVAASTLARDTAASVCVVDARGQNGNWALHDCWGLQNANGLRDALRSTAPITAFCAPISANLSLLTAGSMGSENEELRHSDVLRFRFRELRETFDYVLIDAPPLAESSQTIFLGHLANGIVLVLRANSTRKEAIRRVVAEFEGAGVRVLGAVLNQRRFPIPDAIYTRL